MKIHEFMKPLTLIFLLLIFAASAFGQSTTVSGQVTDAGSQSWNNGTFQFTFVPNPSLPTAQYTWTGGTLNQNISGSMNGTGAYSVSIPSTTAISPGGSFWSVTFCPQATSPCYTLPAITVQGATQTLNATPPAIAISLINPPSSIMRAYSDAEIASAVIASMYYNLPTQLLRICQAVTGQTCSTWANVGSGGGGGGMVWPASPGVMCYAGGSAYCASYTVGTAANDLVQLNGSGQLPAVSAINLTNFPSLLSGVSITGNAGTATNLAGPVALPNGTTATTQSTTDNTQSLATDAFAQSLLASVVTSCTPDGIAYYSSAPILTCVTPPTSNGQYYPGYLVTGGVAVTPTAVQTGFGGRAITGSTNAYTLAYDDNETELNIDIANSVSGTVTLPTATTLGNAKYATSVCNYSAQNWTVTATTWTINTTGSSITVPAGGGCYRIKTDPASATNWLANPNGSSSISSPYATLTDASTVNWAVTPGTANAKLTLGGNRQLAMSGLANGSKGSLFVKQPPSGGPWTLALPAGSLVANNQAGVIPWSSGANAVDEAQFSFDGTNLYWKYVLNFTGASANSFSLVHFASLNATTCNGGTTPTCNLTVASTGTGHLLVLMVSASGSLGAPYTFVSASGGGTWVNCTACYQDLASGSFHEDNIVAYVLSSTSGVTNVSVTLNQNVNNYTMMYYEIAWSGSTISYDTAGISSSSSCSTCTGVGLTPTGGSAEAIVQFGNPGNQVTGITGGTYGNFVQDSVALTGMALQLNSANGTAPSFTGNASGNFLGSGIAFKGN